MVILYEYLLIVRLSFKDQDRFRENVQRNFQQRDFEVWKVLKPTAYSDSYTIARISSSRMII